ncbi:MAG: 4Fe-4S binding protein [Candidatus Humimicrobiaceae bacterium]
MFDYKKCIRCFCCSEVCPEGAIDNKYTFLGNLIVNRYGLGGKNKESK